MGSTIASAEELKRYMGLASITDEQKVQMEDLLAAAQSELEAWLMRPVGLRHVRELATVDSQGYINLQATPVKEIRAISNVDGSTITGTTLDTAFYMDPLVEVLDDNDVAIPALDAAGSFVQYPIRGNGVLYGMPQSQVVIEYIGGYNGPLLPAMKNGIIRVAAREFQRMHDNTMSLRGTDAREPVDDVPTQKGFTDQELDRFYRAKRRVIG